MAPQAPTARRGFFCAKRGRDDERVRVVRGRRPAGDRRAGQRDLLPADGRDRPAGGRARRTGRPEPGAQAVLSAVVAVAGIAVLRRTRFGRPKRRTRAAIPMPTSTSAGNSTWPPGTAMACRARPTGARTGRSPGARPRGRAGTLPHHRGGRHHAGGGAGCCIRRIRRCSGLAAATGPERAGRPGPNPSHPCFPRCCDAVSQPLTTYGVNSCSISSSACCP